MSPSFLGRSNWCDSLAKKLKREQYFEFFSTQLANKPSSSLPIPILADENDFIERLKSHDECAFETMVRRHGTRMLATACKILGNEHDARDALQQAFISAFRSIAAFNATATLSTWLHRIVVNAALMQLRSRRRRPELPIEDLLPRFDNAGRWVDVSDHAGWVEIQPMHRGETRLMVRHCIDSVARKLSISLDPEGP